jgi:ribonuclease PH
MTGAGRFVELGFTAEHGSFGDSDMERMLALARTGISQLVEIQKKFVKLP